MTRPMSAEEIAAIAAEVRDALGDEFDSVTFLDTLEGETDVMETIGRMVQWLTEAEAYEAAMKEVASTYIARAQRFAGQQAVARRVLSQVLDAVGEQKIPHPMATVSRTAPRVSVLVTDEAALPAELVSIVTAIKPDTKAIKEKLEAGEAVPGAELQTGLPGLMVRRK